jgi:hypothetical protein
MIVKMAMNARKRKSINCLYSPSTMKGALCVTDIKN